jgi:hypothetical protein
MKKLLNLKNIAILLLIAVVVFQQCGGNKKGTGEIVKVDGKKYELIKHEIDTVEVVKTKIVTKKGEDIYHETIVEKEVIIPTIVDTAALLKDFFAKNIYKDTLNLPDSLGTVSLIDTITQNKILGRTFNASVKQRTIKETLIVKELPKTQVYYGLTGGFNKADVVSNVGAGLLIKTKKDKIYNLGVGVSNRVTDGTNGTLSPYIGGGVYWKIKFKK